MRISCNSFLFLAGLLWLSSTLCAKPLQIFILAGDENVLENALIEPGKKAESPVGTLIDVVARNPAYTFLKDSDGKWIERDDVLLYDAHPIHNNTEKPATPVQVGVIGRTGPEKAPSIGVDLMLSHRLGEALNEPVLLIRYGVHHQTWFKRGSRDLSHDFRPPSSGGGTDLDIGDAMARTMLELTKKTKN